MLLGTRSLERRGRELVSGYLAEWRLRLCWRSDPTSIRPRSADSCRCRPRRTGSAGARRRRRDARARRHPAPGVSAVRRRPRAALGDVMFDALWPVGEEGRRILARFSGGPAALLEQPRSRRPPADLHLRSGQQVESLPSESGIRALPRRGGALPDRGPAAAADLGASRDARRDRATTRHPRRARLRADAPDRRVAVNVNMEESNPAPISPTSSSPPCPGCRGPPSPTRWLRRARPRTPSGCGSGVSSRCSWRSPVRVWWAAARRD